MAALFLEVTFNDMICSAEFPQTDMTSNMCQITSGICSVTTFLRCIVKETLIKSNSPRSNEHTHAAEFDTLRFNQRILKL